MSPVWSHLLSDVMASSANVVLKLTSSRSFADIEKSRPLVGLDFAIFEGVKHEYDRSWNRYLTVVVNFHGSITERPG